MLQKDVAKASVDLGYASQVHQHVEEMKSNMTKLRRELENKINRSQNKSINIDCHYFLN